MKNQPTDDASRPRCTATSKGTGKQCRNTAIPPTTKCRFHGGMSLRGMASPRFKHGRHSKYLPKHLLSDYQAAVNDPELLSLREQIALLQSREMELTRKLPDKKDYAKTWAELRAIIQERAKLAVAENKRLADVGGFVTLEKLLFVCMGILAAVKEYVQDRDARQAIQTRFNTLLDFKQEEPVTANGEQAPAD